MTLFSFSSGCILWGSDFVSDFIYAFLAVLGLVAAHGLSLVLVSGGYRSSQRSGLFWWLLLQSTGSRAGRLQELWRTDLVAPLHVGSSGTRDRAHVPCTGKRILNQWTTKDVP